MTSLMNAHEALPTEFYIFVNLLNPMTEHNWKLIGQFHSGAFSNFGTNKDFLPKYINGNVNYLPFIPSNSDGFAISPYLSTAINNYRVEYDAEIVRQMNFKLYPSRLSAIYAFGDMATCYKVSQKYGWDINSVKRFKLIDNPLNRIVKANMEIVSVLRHAYRVSSIQDQTDLWSRYWKGDDKFSIDLPSSNFSRQTYHSEVIWEYLIEGVVKDIDRT